MSSYKIWHISQFNPEVHDGGVATFARYLKQAVPELRWRWAESQSNPWEDARTRNENAVRDGEIGPSDIVIADGYYGLGLTGKVARLIVVCHSTYAGWIRDCLMQPYPHFDATWLIMAAEAQRRAYREADLVVAVSPSARDELWDFYQIDAKMIRNGIDVNTYTPDETVRDCTVVALAGDAPFKGSDVIMDLQRKANLVIDQLGFEGEKVDRWRGYEIAVFPSRHEGGAYGLLEAMAMNKKVVTSMAGMAKEIPDRYLWRTHDLYWRTYRDLILEAMESEGRNPREWVLKHATLEMFRKQWSELLG